MNPYNPMLRNPMMQVMQQYQQIKQNPNQLGSFLKQRGIINDQQMKEISHMGGNYEQVGQYLMNNGMMPQPSQNVINQAQQALHPPA